MQMRRNQTPHLHLTHGFYRLAIETLLGPAPGAGGASRLGLNSSGLLHDLPGLIFLDAGSQTAVEINQFFRAKALKVGLAVAVILGGGNQVGPGEAM